MAAGKVSGNATLEQPYRVRRDRRSLFRRGLPARLPQRATVVTLHNTVDLPTRSTQSQQREEACRCDRPGHGRHRAATTQLRLYAGPKQTDMLSSIHADRRRRQADGPTLEPLIQYGMAGPSSPSRSILALRFLYAHGVPQLGLGHHHRSPSSSTLVLLPTRLHDDEVVAEDDAHPAQGRRHQAQVRQPQNHRSQARRDERRDDGAL